MSLDLTRAIQFSLSVAKSTNPDSFNIQDTQNEIVQLKEAKAVTDNPDVIKLIDKRLVELLGEDPDEILISTETPNTDDSV